MTDGRPVGQGRTGMTQASRKRRGRESASKVRSAGDLCCESLNPCRPRARASPPLLGKCGGHISVGSWLGGRLVRNSLLTHCSSKIVSCTRSLHLDNFHKFFLNNCFLHDNGYQFTEYIFTETNENYKIIATTTDIMFWENLIVW